ncbi:MAG: hypothetical protein ACFFEX_02095 [Candidatus Thorarchaeota archaeon]
MRSKKKKSSNTRSRWYANLFFLVNISFLIALWLLTQYYPILPQDILLSWLSVTIVMIVILWFVDRRAAKMVLEDLSRSP